MNKAQRDAIRALPKPDCRGNPCIFGNTGGQRTQGGCRCLNELPPPARRYIGALVGAVFGLLDQVDELELKTALLPGDLGEMWVRAANAETQRDALKAEVERLREKLAATAAECADVCEEQARRLEATDDRGEIWKDGKAMAAGARHCAIYVRTHHTESYLTLELLKLAAAERDQARARVAELELEDSPVFNKRLREPTADDCGHLLTQKLCGTCRSIEQLEAERDQARAECDRLKAALDDSEAEVAQYLNEERAQLRARVAELSGNCADCGGWSPTGCHVCITRGQKMAERVASLEAALHDIAAQWSNVAQHGGTAVASSMARTAREVLAPGWGSKLDAVLAPAVTKEAG